MSSGLTILIGFIISAVLMLTVWLASKNTREKNRNLSGIEKQKTEIIDIIERAVGEGQKGAKPQRQASGNGGMPVWGKWFMALSVVPLIGSFVLAGMQGQGVKQVTPQTTTSAAITTISSTLTNTYQTVTTTQPTTPEVANYTVGSNPYGICFDGSNIWVANDGSDTVTKLRASDGYIIGTYSVGEFPQGIGFDGNNIWVTSRDNSVIKLDPINGSIIGTYEVGNYPLSLCFDGTNTWVANDGGNSVTKLRTSDGFTLGTYAVGNNPQDICFDGTNIWVADGSNNVFKLRTIDGSILGTYPVGTPTTSSVHICFYGTNIWVVNSTSNNVTELRASDGSTLDTYPVGDFPQCICLDGTNIWVANFNSNSVTKLPIIVPLTTTQSAVITAQSGDTIEVDYTLKLSDGSVYQTTVGTGQPFQFELGVDQVIAGFDAAVTGMAVGQTKTVTIPAAQAYGTRPSASNPLAGQDLTFIITLLKIIPQ